MTGSCPTKNLADATSTTASPLCRVGVFRLGLLLLAGPPLRRLLCRKVHPGLRYAKHDRLLLWVLNSLGRSQAFLCVLPIFFCFARHGRRTSGRSSRARFG
jgi:hypothetical protein